MKINQESNFIKGPIFSPLVKFALPIMGALALQFLYGVVDLWVVSRFAQTSDISAVAIGSQTIDPAVVQASFEFLKATSLETGLLALVFCFTGYFVGVGKTKFVMIQGLLGACVVKVPFAYFISTTEYSSLFTIGLSTVLAAVVMLILCGVYYYIYERNRRDSDFDSDEPIVQ